MTVPGMWEHVQTPPDMRTPLWWLQEHAIAERAVTIASNALSMGGDARYMTLWEKRLDVTLDHLETVDDACDGILRDLRAAAPEWVADVAERHYLRGETWGEAAERLSVSKRNAQTRLSCALERLSDKEIVTH